MEIRVAMRLRIHQVLILCEVASAALIASHAREKCSCSDCQAVLRRHAEGSFAQTNSLEAIDQKLTCERNDGNLTHHCANFCSRDCRATLPKKSRSTIPCEANPGTPRVVQGLSLSQLSVARQMLSCPEPLPCFCTCNCPPIQYGTPLPPPPLPPFATASPPQLSVGMLQVPTGIPAETAASIAYGQNGAIMPSLSALQGAALHSMGMAPPPPPPKNPSQVSFMQLASKEQTDGVPNIVIGPPLPPLPPLPPPVARGACPKSAGCNCYCPCRDEPQR